MIAGRMKVAIGAALVGVIGLSALTAHADESDSASVITGTLRVVHGHQRNDVVIETPDGALVGVNPEQIGSSHRAIDLANLAGHEVALTDARLDDLGVRTTSVNSAASADSATTADGTAVVDATVKRLAVIMVNTTGDPRTPFQAADVRRVIHDASDAASKYWQDATDGAYTFTPVDVFGWVTMSAPLAGCDYFKWQPEINTLATAKGFNPSSYTNVLYFVAGQRPEPDGCPGAAWATMPGKDSWYPTGTGGVPTSAVIAHELGHNFGLRHAFSQSGCSGFPCENGDRFDIMGDYAARANMLRISGFHLDRLGLLGSSDVRVLTSTATVELSPLERKGALPRFIKFIAPNDDVFWIEYRQAIGPFDSRIPALDATQPGLATALDGVLIRQNWTVQSHAYLIDTTPNSVSWEAGDLDTADAALRTGRSFRHPYLDFWVVVIARTPEKITVQVGSGLGPAPKRNPRPGSPQTLPTRT